MRQKSKLFKLWFKEDTSWIYYFCWDIQKSEVRYEWNKNNEIVVNENISFVNRKSTLAAELEFEKKTDIKYIVDGNFVTWPNTPNAKLINEFDTSPYILDHVLNVFSYVLR